MRGTFSLRLVRAGWARRGTLAVPPAAGGRVASAEGADRPLPRGCSSSATADGKCKMETAEKTAATELRVNDLHEKTGQFMKRVASGERFVLVDRWGLPLAHLTPASEVSV